MPEREPLLLLLPFIFFTSFVCIIPVISILMSEALLHMNTVYRYRAVLLAHNGQESVNVTCPRYYREDLSDSSLYEPTSVGGAPSLVTG